MIFLLFFTLLFSPSNHPQLVHDFHLSKTDINYDTKSKSIQLSIHLFLDDLEDALKLEGYVDLRLCSPREAEHSDKAIQQYLQKKLQLYTHQTPLKWEYLGKEGTQDKMAVYCYLEISNVSQIKTLKISNNIMHELFDDQKNIVSVTEDKKSKAFLILDKKKLEETVKY